MLAAACMALLVLLSAATPYLSPPARALLMDGFSLVCHQLPSRSPHIEGVQLAVCHRCFGIYWGFLLGALCLGLFRPPVGLLDRYAPYLVGASLIPLGIDWGGDFLGWWVNTPLSRLLTGGVFGIVAGCYLARAFAGHRRSAESPKVAPDA